MKRILALLLCLVMALSLIPAAAAEEIEIIDKPAGADAFGLPLDDDIVIIDPADGPVLPNANEDGSTAVASGECGDGVVWFLYDTGRLEIRGTGSIEDYEEKGAPWWPYRDQITSLTINNAVKSIGTYAFAGCSKMKFHEWQGGQALPYQMLRIERGAFKDCASLEYVCIPRGVTLIGGYAFDGCTSLKRVTVGGAPDLGGYCFANCTGLEEFSFLGDAPYFSSTCFVDSAAAKVWYPDDNDTWVESKLQDYGSDGLTWVPGYHGWCGDEVCWDLDKATGELSMSGSGETWSCEQKGIDQYGQIAYTGNSGSLQYMTDSIKSIEVGEGITSLGGYIFLAFENYLKSIKLPSSLKVINFAAFSTCSVLEEITFCGNAPSFDRYSFSKVTATAYYPEGDPSWTEDVRQNYNGEITWVPYKVSVEPTITTQPKSQTAAADSTVEFTVSAIGAGMSYQWYYRKNADSSWAKSSLTGNKTETLTVKATEARNGYQYKCKVSNAAGYKYSSAATLTVVTKPTITTQPTSQSAAVDSTVKFKVVAEGAESFQWQYRKNSSDSWHNSTSTGNKTATLSVKATEARDGFQFRCRVKNAAGTTYSKYAKLTVCTKPTITTQPTSQTAAVDTTVKFTVKATGGALSYQWYYRKSSTDSWLSSSSTGNKTATLTVTATEARNGFQFRCRVKNAAGTTYSKYAKLTVCTKPTITTQPTSKTASADTTVTFTVKATGGALSYQWQYRKSSTGTWYNSTQTGAKTATLTVTATAARNGFQYRCKITNIAGTTYSKAATLTVK